ncbi:PH domain-containing protein [Streptomyces kebangsaanensis]|uniref:PH domain-containing protein n=1 Tax=Streptomyces kebangsaanensis TaxID=864058 RepID=UPI000939C5C5|nr:PH domain-containing protein [Streptomyces kebangsaanensis]
MRTDLAERRRQARRERRARVERLAGTMAAPEVPLVWGAGWGARVTAAVWCVVVVVVADHPAEAGLAHPRPGPLVSSLVAGWICSWLALWRITADRDGVYIRRLWSTRFLPWSTISRVEMRHDGQLEFFGPGKPGKEPMAGLFSPPWLSRVLRRSDGRGQAAADTLTAMVRHGRLRPTVQAERALIGSGLVRWAVVLAAGLYGAAAFLHR